VHHNTLTADRGISLEEAEYIVSQATCFWARKFTVLWTTWCEEEGGIDNEDRSEIEWLMCYPDLLRKAAREYCPKGPKRQKRPRTIKTPGDVIIIDD